MVDSICKVVHDYEKRLQDVLCVLGFSYGHRMVQEDGGMNRMFFTYPFFAIRYGPTYVS